MNVVPTLELQQPTAGSIWYIGMTQTIQWESQYFGNDEKFIMSLDIIGDDGKSKSITLDTNVLNSGSTRYTLSGTVFGNI